MLVSACGFVNFKGRVTLLSYCGSLRGKQVFQVPAEFVGDVDHVLAVSEAARSNSKVLLDNRKTNVRESKTNFWIFARFRCEMSNIFISFCRSWKMQIP